MTISTRFSLLGLSIVALGCAGSPMRLARMSPEELKTQTNQDLCYAASSSYGSQPSIANEVKNRRLDCGAVLRAAGLTPINAASMPAPVPTVSYDLPTLSLQPQTLQVQKKGGVTISLTPAEYVESVDSRREEVEVRRDTTRTWTLKRDSVWRTPIRLVEVRTSPMYTVSPNRLGVVVHIANQMPRVFRANGMLVKFRIGGQLIPAESQGRDGSDAVIPPQAEADLRFWGPWLTSVQDGPISVMMYDVPSATDAAGNVTARENFTWDFAYSTRRVTKSAAVRVAQRVDTIGRTIAIPFCRPPSITVNCTKTP